MDSLDSRSPRRPRARALAACPTLLVLALFVGAGPAGAHHLDAAPAGAPGRAGALAPHATVVEVRLSEWSVKLVPAEVPAGPVSFHVTNAGKVPHAFEIEGHGIERRTPEIQPGATATLEVSVKLAATKAYKMYTSYEVYCPVGKGSHKMLGMRAHLAVEPAHAAGHDDHDADRDATHGEDHGMDHAMAADDAPSGPRAMRVQGGGDVIQILPGPYPFADSARAIIDARPPDQQADLTKKAHMGPYSNVVATIGGTISVYALDRGAEGDSVAGHAEFTTQDGARWTLALDRVQTKDIPFNPRFGGVIMGLFYHGGSGVHTPLVPTIQSSLALWGYAHLDKNGVRVSDDAMVHIMLLSRTRRPGDWALDCWDCSDRPVEELQLQVTPPPGAAPFDAPGGFLFVNWEKSSGEKLAVE
jgi:hypothetical protein